MSAHHDDIVITGLAATSPLGGTARSTWQALLAGASAAVPLTEAWAAGLPVRIAAPAAVEPGPLLDRIQARRTDRAAQFALVALREAWADAGFTGAAGAPGAPAAERVAVVVGSGIGGLGTLLPAHDLIRAGDTRRVSPYTLPMLMTNAAAALCALEVNATAAAQAPATACAAGADAVATGLDLIRAGRADVVVAGGTEAVINPMAITAFAAMKALSRTNDAPACASRPFDKKRDGFVLGEGAALLVLESGRHARARGARIYAELAGAGMSADAHHVARPHPSGAGMAHAIERALDDAGLAAGDIGHISAHASSTPAGDAAEATAIRSALDGPGRAVSAIKASAGHLIGASGALAAAMTVLALHHRVAPPIVNLEDPDDACDLDLVRGEPRPLPPGGLAALSHSAGFGGHNTVLAFRNHRPAPGVPGPG
ncbi:beta-ketoacyl-[acyl-carrier-protein] synthase family protein [Streptomyces sp. NPDC020362]|uniref:beta-ketoacyl-[acyl-carrier-protein] synthase family protein n=1 Tax=unclassified Streptomyces TaxID=2593676 RepID=UPI0033D55315